jgi:preprotein translocase subunit YajC
MPYRYYVLLNIIIVVVTLYVIRWRVLRAAEKEYQQQLPNSHRGKKRTQNGG